MDIPVISHSLRKIPVFEPGSPGALPSERVPEQLVKYDSLSLPNPEGGPTTIE